MSIARRALLRRVKRHILSRLHLWRPAGAALTILPSDAFLVSYPRSGNTWLRFLIAHLIHKAPLDFRELEFFVADIYQNSDRELLALPQPRILKSHELLDERYRKVVYIARDPRDVAVSFYYWRLRQETAVQAANRMTLEEYLRTFIQGEYAFSRFNWAEHVCSWLPEGIVPGSRVLAVQYEQMKKDPAGVLRSVASHIGVIHDQGGVEHAVRLSSFANVQAAERGSWIAGRKAGIPFARKGTSGQWRDVFTPELNRLYWESFGEEMARFGYTFD